MWVVLLYVRRRAASEQQQTAGVGLRGLAACCPAAAQPTLAFSLSADPDLPPAPGVDGGRGCALPRPVAVLQGRCTRAGGRWCWDVGALLLGGLCALIERRLFAAGEAGASRLPLPPSLRPACSTCASSAPCPTATPSSSLSRCASAWRSVQHGWGLRRTACCVCMRVQLHLTITSPHLPPCAAH